MYILKYTGYILFLVILLLNSVVSFLEPISWGIAGAAVLYLAQHFLRTTSTPKWTKSHEPEESCNAEWIYPDLTKATNELNFKLYGQHLVTNITVNALKGHMRKNKPKKALVLSFHGFTGCGKTYASELIVNNLYAAETRSRFVHKLTATAHFPHKDLVDTYRRDLYDWIRSNVSLCPQSVFVFDEVDKMPPKLLDVIYPFLDYHEDIDGIDFSRAVYIFLSNNAGSDIFDITYKHWYAGKKREDIKLKDFYELLASEAFNTEGGLSHTTVVDRHLIDHYVPFLPLERNHVEQCILDELQNRRHREEDKQQIIDYVQNEMIYLPEDELHFSETGCKRVEKLVDLAVEEIYG